MRRSRIFIFAAVILLLALIGTAYWATTTPRGMHFLLRAVSAFSSVHMEAREIKGSLADSNVKATGLIVRWGEVEISCGILDIAWQPREFWRRNLVVEKIRAKEIRIHDRRRALKEPPKIVWPVIAWLGWINGRADDIQAEDLIYRRLEDPPIAIGRISSSLALEGGVLRVKEFRISSPKGQGEGTGSMSFAQPELHLRIKALPAEEFARCDSFSANIDLLPGRGLEQTGGLVRISGSRGASEILRLEGRIGLALNAITFQDFELIQPGRKGIVKGKGEWRFSDKDGIAGQIFFTDLDLEQQIGQGTKLSGAADLKGTLDTFQGSFRVANAGDRWQTASMEGRFQSAGKKVTIEDLKGGWLSGQISGKASIGWQDAVTAEVFLQGRNLNPGEPAFGKRAPIHFDLEGRLLFPGGHPVGDIQVRLAEKEGGPASSRAELKIRLKEKATHTASFSLRLPRGEVQASLSGSYHEGTLEEIIEKLEGKDPSGSWVMEEPTRVRVSSRELKLMPVRLSSARGEKVKLAAHLQFDPLRGTMEAVWQQVDLARANQFFEKDYVAGRTKGEVTARWHKDKGWQVAGVMNVEGSVTQNSMLIRVPSGFVKIAWDERGLESSADLKIGGGGRIEGKVSSPGPVIPGLPEKGRAEIIWHGIDLALFQPILPSSLRLQGHSFGRLQGNWLPQFRLQGSGEAGVSKTDVTFPLRERPVHVGLEKGNLTFSLNQNRLSGNFDLGLKDHGLLKGTYSLPLAFHPSFEVKAEEPLDLSVRGRVDDRGLLAAVFPEALQRSRGGVDVDLHVRGSRANPKLIGTFVLTGADIRFGSGQNEEKRAVSEIPGIGIAGGQMDFEWDEKGLGTIVKFDLRGGGRLKGKISSPEARPFDFPRQWEYNATWDGADLSFLRPFAPPSLEITGKMSGQIDGKWLPEGQWQAAGNCRVATGTVRWQAKGGAFEKTIEKAEVAFNWREEWARGDFSLHLADYGWVEGKFILPLPARFPFAAQPSGSLELAIQGKIQERDLLSALAPERIRSTRGTIDLDLAVRGTWEKPRFSGIIRAKDVEAQIRARQERTVQKANAEGNPGRELILKISSGILKGEWSEQGLRGELDLSIGNGGHLQAQVSSREPARMAIPPEGEIDAAWKSIDAGIFQTFIPEAVSLQGSIKGKMHARWSRGFRLDARGDIEIASASLMWQGNGGNIKIGIAEARTGFFWKEEGLTGDFALNLSQYGFLKGTFAIPLVARIPAVMNHSGPIHVSLEGQVQEKGLLPAVLPGIVQESRGEMKVGLNISGTWKSPKFDGDLYLTKAGGYLPTLGVTLEELSARIKLKDDQIRIETFQAKSRPGEVKGTANLWIKDWQLSRYEGTLEGDNFQTVRLPEMQIQTSPRLTFRGTPKKISVRGDIQIPEFLLYGKVGTSVHSSSDVILMDEKPRPRSDFESDIKVRLILGKRVLVKIAGVDAQMEGALEAEILGFEREKMTARGEIRVKEEGGYYTAYGVHLKIVKGRLIFAGPMDHPSLDITALRQVHDAQKGEEIQAGVRVTGDIQKPQIKLYSQPAMGETDILAYMVLGRPFNQKSGDLDLIGSAAGALIRQLESVTLQDRMKRYVNLDTMDVQSGGGDIRSSIVTIGKYVNPNLYLSLGKSVFSNSAILTLRYEFSKEQKWEVATRSGDQSGVFLYYRLEFE